MQSWQRMSQAKNVQRIDRHRHHAGIHASEQRRDVFNTWLLDNQDALAKMAILGQNGCDSPNPLIQRLVVNRLRSALARIQESETCVLSDAFSLPFRDVNERFKTSRRRLVERALGRVVGDIHTKPAGRGFGSVVGAGGMSSAVTRPAYVIGVKCRLPDPLSDQDEQSGDFETSLTIFSSATVRQCFLWV